MSVTTWKCFPFCAFVVLVSHALAEPGIKIAIREALELASRKSGREIVGTSAREATEQTLERSAAKFGNRVFAAASDGGLELIEATTKYGDDVMKYAVEVTPAARRALALNTETLLPIARRVGPEALELEAKAPGLAGKVFACYGDDAGKMIARNVPADDIPRLVAYAERADSQATRDILLQTYRREGKTLFERIPPKLVLAGGLTTAMLYTAFQWGKVPGEIADKIKNDPAAATGLAKHFIGLVGLIVAMIVVLLLWRFKLMPWQGNTKERASMTAPKQTASPTDKDDGKPRTLS